ncbi:MAG: hypothetical protein ABEJ42_02100 [Halobacteriaceae archaeon]
MTEDPFEPEPPFAHECSQCGSRIEAEDHDPEAELVECPDCGGDLVTVSTASGE